MTSSTPTVSVVIPVLDGVEVIGEQLDALAAQVEGPPFEVVVADNGSTDGTAEIALRWRSEGLDVRIADAGGAPGISHARNEGIRLARTERIAICDADDRVSPTWVAAMARGIDLHGVLTGPLLVTEINPPEVATSRGLGTESVAPTFHGLFPYAHGCNQGLHRDIWADVGGFDDSMAGIASEDIDFGLRLHLAGVGVGFAADAAVHYRYRRGVRPLLRQGRAYGYGRTVVARRAANAGLAVPHFAGLRSWAWLAINLPAALLPSRRESWAWVAGNRLGQLHGSLHHRIVYL